MGHLEEIDYFTDASLVVDPQPYFDYLRTKGPVVRLPQGGVVAVTGYDEGLAIFRDEERYSSINSASGTTPLPFTPDSDDITDQIEQHRHSMPYAGLIAMLDPPAHTKLRALLMGMITPKRMAENQEFMSRLADRLIDEFIDNGRVEVMSEFGQPFATLVIADLLGVPEEDHGKFRTIKGSTPGLIDGLANASNNPLAEIGGYFLGYIEDRRRTPRKDVLTQLAHAKYPDGTLPAAFELVALAAFLFAAGQETTVRVIGAMLRFVAEDQTLQKKLREQRDLIPNFIEETLRLESAVKTDFRLTKVPVTIGSVEAAPGTPVALLIAALNRDPRRFDNPHELRIDRKNAREHLAFGRGIHACAGAPLARAELKTALERILDRTAAICINEAEHGPAEARRFEYAPTYVFRGMNNLHLDLTPSAKAPRAADQ